MGRRRDLEDAPRCNHCCSHGVPLIHWCGWCEDIEQGMDDCIIPEDEPQWLCPHGIGVAIG